MSVQIIQTPHGFSLTATRYFAPSEHVLDLTGIPKSTKDRYSIQISLFDLINQNIKNITKEI
jgi:hypothetical protein